jgi:hypothetical protein
VTLRADIRTAIDAVAPPAPELRSKALASVQDERQRRDTTSSASGRTRRPFINGLGYAAAIAAVLIVVLLIVALLAGGRILQDWKRFNTPQPVGINQAVVDQLRKRPLAFPVLKASDQCPISPTKRIDYGGGNFTNYGAGPVYAVGASPTTTKWGAYFDIQYVTDPELTGPVLIRGRDLRTNELVVFVGQYASGVVVGTDMLDGKPAQQRADAVFDAGKHEHSNLLVGGPTRWGIFPVRQGVAADFSHCFGIQFDGPGFTEVVTGNG